MTFTSNSLFFVYSKKLICVIFHCKDTLFNPCFQMQSTFKRKFYDFLTYVFRWVIFGVIRKLDMSGDTEKILFILLFIVIQ